MIDSRGANCPFRHEPLALGCETVCSYWQRGRCSNVHCKFRHMKLTKNRKSIKCYWESQPGGCLKPHCPFMHLKRCASCTHIAPENVASDDIPKDPKASTPRGRPNLPSTISSLDKDTEKIINILLLGETGVGKSTFINSVINYLSFQNLEEAEKGGLIVLIPTAFTAYDKDENNVRLEVGEKHKNEDNTVGSSVTQLIRTYTFSIKGGYKVRLIDTPGMGDKRGPEQDQKNCEYILGYISNLHYLHAICYLLRPQVSRATVIFRHCITEFLSRLEKSVCDNLIFIFTDSKNYTPGGTYSILKKLAEDIKQVPPHANIPVGTNIFCFDNEPFKYLAAKQQGVQFAVDLRRIMIENWDKSTDQCWRLIEYVSKLKPHNVRNTAPKNDCRRIIYQLSQPTADIAQNIDDNLHILERHKDFNVHRPNPEQRATFPKRKNNQCDIM